MIGRQTSIACLLASAALLLSSPNGWAADAGLPPPDASMSLEPPLRAVATVPQAAQSDRIHAIIAKYGLKCANPTCPVCYPQNTSSP